MIGNVGIIRDMAREAYGLKVDQINEKLRAMPRWPSDRAGLRIVGIEEAMKRLAKPELAELVFVGFILTIETEGGVLYPVRTFDFMTGLNSDEHVAVAKSDLELLQALKGSDSPIDDLH